MPRPSDAKPWLTLAALVPALGGCAGGLDLTDHDCLARAMYFESNRSSPDGMLAVGTTVMNRLDDPRYPKSVCGVVGQPRQFAPGVLDKPMTSKGARLASEMADRVLAGERHPRMGADALFFHTAGLTFPYTNMHYVVVAGGNAFYEKRAGASRPVPAEPAPAAGEVASAADEVARAPDDPQPPGE